MQRSQRAAITRTVNGALYQSIKEHDHCPVHSRMKLESSNWEIPYVIDGFCFVFVIHYLLSMVVFQALFKEWRYSSAPERQSFCPMEFK